MVASHSTCGSLYEHIRSKPDSVIRAIADTGGYIGICCIPRFLRHSGDITALLDHIDYVVKKFGPDHAAIGTDVAYQSRNAARERAKYPARPKRRTRWAALWPPDNFKTTGRMIQSIGWTNWPPLHRRPRSERPFRRGDSEDHRSERLASPGSEPSGLASSSVSLLRDRGCKDVDLTVHPPFENGQPRRPAANSVRGPRHVVTSHDSP